MNGHRPHVPSFEASQGKLLEAFQSIRTAGLYVGLAGTKLSPSYQEQVPIVDHLAHDAVLVPATKRPLDAVTNIDPPAKRARLTRSGSQLSEAEDERALEV